MKLADKGETHPVIRWLMTDARRRTDSSEFLEAFADELRAAGVDVSRITTGVPILHPQIFSFSGLWQLDKGTTERLYRAGPEFAGDDGETARSGSPMKAAARCAAISARRQATANSPFSKSCAAMASPTISCTRFRSPTAATRRSSLATTRRGGFSSDELALFEAMIPAVAFNLEVQALRRTARTLLDTYVGQQSGGRVLEGQIQRGTGETIRAVIWLCDLRGFTNLSETLPRDALIDLLNCYFGPMCDAVAAQGGEILKFIGDAMLAIFPIAADAGQTCAAALRAAEHAAGRHSRRKTSGGTIWAWRRSTTAWRCMSATSCMAISAAIPGSISP